MEPLTDKQLTQKAAAFFKAKGNEDHDSIFMTDDGQIFLKDKKSYASGHSHGTKSGEVYEFFRSKVFNKLSNGSQEEVDNTNQESSKETPKKQTKEEKKEADKVAKEEAKAKEEEEKKAAQEEKEKEEAEKKKKEEEEQEETFEDQVKRIGDMTPEDREKELSTYEDDDDKDNLIEAILKYTEENKPDVASDLPEEFQKPIGEMTEDELINLAKHLGSESSEPQLRKGSMDDIKAHVEDLAAKSKTELIK